MQKQLLFVEISDIILMQVKHGAFVLERWSRHFSFTNLRKIYDEVHHFFRKKNAFRFEWKVDKILVTKKKCWKSIESVKFNSGAVLRFAPSFPLSFAIIVVQLFPGKTFSHLKEKEYKLCKKNMKLFISLVPSKVAVIKSYHKALKAFNLFHFLETRSFQLQNLFSCG